MIDTVSNNLDRLLCTPPAQAPGNRLSLSQSSHCGQAEPSYQEEGLWLINSANIPPEHTHTCGGEIRAQTEQLCQAPLSWSQSPEANIDSVTESGSQHTSGGEDRTEDRTGLTHTHTRTLSQVIESGSVGLCSLP